MADTGAPWNLPYPLPTDLVRDGAQAIEDLAEATADGLSAAGGLVAVKHVLKTDTFTSGSVSGGASVAVPGLSLSHALADEDNRLIITAFFGAAANSEGGAQVGIAVNDGTNFLAIGDAEGSRTRITAGGYAATTGSNSAIVVTMPSVTFVHDPQTTASLTYTVHAFNILDLARTLFVNRPEFDTNSTFVSRAASALVIQEVKV